jgi:hypothetical protein
MALPLFALRPPRHFGNRLENRQAGKRLVGSNPTPFAFWDPRLLTSVDSLAQTVESFPQAGHPVRQMKACRTMLTSCCQETHPEKQDTAR